MIYCSRLSNIVTHLQQRLNSNPLARSAASMKFVWWTATSAVVLLMVAADDVCMPDGLGPEHRKNVTRHSSIASVCTLTKTSPDSQKRGKKHMTWSLLRSSSVAVNTVLCISGYVYEKTVE